MPIIQKEIIIARKNETGRRIKCKNCMNDRDFQQMAKNELLLGATVQELYSKGNIIFCDNCNINLYSFIFELEGKNPEEAPVPPLPEEEINLEEFPMHLYPPQSSVFGKEDQQES